MRNKGIRAILATCYLSTESEEGLALDTYSLDRSTVDKVPSPPNIIFELSSLAVGNQKEVASRSQHVREYFSRT